MTPDGVDDHPSSDVVTGSTRIEILRIVIKNMTLRYAGGGSCIGLAWSRRRRHKSLKLRKVESAPAAHKPNSIYPRSGVEWLHAGRIQMVITFGHDQLFVGMLDFCIAIKFPRDSQPYLIVSIYLDPSRATKCQIWLICFHDQEVTQPAYDCISGISAFLRFCTSALSMSLICWNGDSGMMVQMQHDRMDGSTEPAETFPLSSLPDQRRACIFTWYHTWTCIHRHPACSHMLQLFAFFFPREEKISSRIFLGTFTLDITAQNVPHSFASTGAEEANKVSSDPWWCLSQSSNIAFFPTQVMISMKYAHHSQGTSPIGFASPKSKKNLGRSLQDMKPLRW